MAATHLIVGTAGHIDHGKTTLVGALTGVNLDRLPEEQARGITIALGFTHLALPSGRVAAFVDVPGHERLVRTMIAGASGLDAVVLCVAATEGVMPQTREHLAILELVGVSHGFVALTMCDLADADTVELARMEVEDVVAGTFLEGQPILETASGPQPMGLDAVTQTLDKIAVLDRPADGVFRLPIDRAFIQKGFGTVVTGTVRAGSVRDGADVRIEPIGLSARIRGMQVHGDQVSETRGGLRTAINLAGIERDDLTRGMVIIADAAVTPASIVDARVHLLPSAPVLETAARVRLLVDTAEVMAVIDVIGAERITPGAEAWVQLRTETPIVALPGDRFILRRESPVETLGGGTVLDPWAPRARRKRHPAVVNELEALQAGDNGVFLTRAGTRGLHHKTAAARGATDGVRLGDRVFHTDLAADLEDTLTTRLGDWHQAHPLASGAPRRELHTGPLSALDERAFGDLLARLDEAGAVVLQGPRIRLAAFAIELDAAQAATMAQLEEELIAAGLAGLPFGPTVESHGDLLHLLIGANKAERVNTMVVHREQLDNMIHSVRTHLHDHGQLKPADFKALTHLTRKYAIPLMEWLDAKRITVRRGDSRFAADY